MSIPTIISAFGTTTRAVATYRSLDQKIRDQLPDDDIFWSYTSRVITRELKEKQKNEIKPPEQLLQSLADQGAPGAVLQSLHLFPGKEFHKLLTIAKEAPLPCATGMPLFTSPDDYKTFANLFETIINQRADRAILLLGHGTTHPGWTAYYSLEKIFRRRFGERIFVGVVEQFPDSSELLDEISTKGFTKVTIVPLFLIAGMHFRRDIISKDPGSWQSRLVAKGMDVESLESGIGLLPGIEKLVIEHILEARRKLA